MGANFLKHCSGCEAEKPTSEFHRTAARPDGLAAICKVCQKEKDCRRYEQITRPAIQANREEHLDRMRDYYQRNREHLKALALQRKRQKRQPPTSE